MPAETNDGKTRADIFRKKLTDRKEFSGETEPLKKQHGSTPGFLPHSKQGGM